MACSSGSATPATSAGANSLLCLLPLKLQQQSCSESCRLPRAKLTEKEKGRRREGGGEREEGQRERRTRKEESKRKKPEGAGGRGLNTAIFQPFSSKLSAISPWPRLQIARECCSRNPGWGPSAVPVIKGRLTTDHANSGPAEAVHV